jgi:hypothetical protein
LPSKKPLKGLLATICHSSLTRRSQASSPASSKPPTRESVKTPGTPRTLSAASTSSRGRRSGGSTGSSNGYRGSTAVAVVNASPGGQELPLQLISPPQFVLSKSILSIPSQSEDTVSISFVPEKEKHASTGPVGRTTHGHDTLVHYGFLAAVSEKDETMSVVPLVGQRYPGIR